MSARTIPAIAVALIAAAIVWQLFLPEAAGLANNGDFAKVIAAEGFAPVTGTADEWDYFVRDFRFDPAYYWDSGLYSSERALFRITARIARAFWGGALDIRSHGLWHLAVILAGLGFGAAAVSTLPRAAMLGTSVLGVLVFADIAYTIYINSFFADAAAIAGLILCFGAGAYLAVDGKWAWGAVLSYVAGLCLVAGSKPQHSMLIVPGVVCLLVVLHGRRELAVRITRIVGILASLAAVGLTWGIMPGAASNSGSTIYNAIFFKILPNSPDPAADLAFFGLDPGLLRYSGQHAFMPDCPCSDGDWLQRFERQTSSASVAHYWLLHPLRLARVAWIEFKLWAPGIRTPLGHLPRGAGLPPKSQLPSLTRWCDAKAALLRAAPAGYILLLVAAVAAGLWRLCSVTGSKMSCLCAVALLMLALSISIEFLVATGFEATETDRHFILMHLLMDLLLIVIVGAGLSLRSGMETSRR